MVLIQLLRMHLRTYRRSLAAVVALQLVGTLASLYLPRLNADIIDRGVVSGDTGYILRTGGTMLLVTALQIVCLAAAVWFGTGTAMRVGRDLRAAVFHRVGEFSNREVARFGVSSLIVRNTNDVQQIQLLVMLGCSMLVAAPITCVGGVILAVRDDPGLSWVVVVSVPVLAATIGVVASRMLPRFRRMQSQLDGVNRVLREQISGIRVVRAFVRERDEAARFARANDALTDTATGAGRLLALVTPIVMLVLNLSCVAVLWFGAARIDTGDLQFGELTAFLSYLLQILMSVMVATFVLMTVPRAAVGADRIMEVLGTASSIVPPALPVRMLPPSADLEMRGVWFHYPGAAEPVLRDITLRARAGQTTAVVGSIGSGKTTLLGLVPRLFEATVGSVRVGGLDVRAIDQETLWSTMALVPQRSYLFTGTVAGNLRYGRPDATDDDLWAALDVAQARDFVKALPEGLDAPVAQGGSNFSGGQKQRLAIARAVVRRPSIYLLDDAFSALDQETDSRVRRELRAVTGRAAVVVVAQRISTVADADRIVVLEHGAIVGSGTHDELLATCPTYAEIVASQSSGSTR